jgi:hypothetical protein
MVKDGDVREQLVAKAIELLADEQRRRQLSNNIGAFGIKDADDVVAADILKSIGRK